MKQEDKQRLQDLINNFFLIRSEGIKWSDIMDICEEIYPDLKFIIKY